MTFSSPILAPCRVRRRAAFRRVAGGVLPERGQGEAAVARDARPYHGGLQRFERMGVEEEWHDAYECYAVVIVPGFFMKVAGDHDLAEIVADMSKRKCLLRAFLGVGNRIRRLDVDALVGKVDDKVDFVSSDFMFPGFSRLKLHNANVHRVTAPDEFGVDDVLHEVRLFILSKVDAGVAEPGIGGVVLAGRFKVAASFDVVSLGLVYEEGVFEESKILAYCGRVGVELRDGVHCVADPAWICETADSAHDDVKQTFYRFGVLDVVALDDVFEVDGPVEVVEIGLPLGVGFGQHTSWESAEGEIFVEYGLNLPPLAKRHEFGKREWRDMNRLAASAEDSCDVGNEKLGVGSGDIDIDASHGSQFAENAVEGDVCAFAVVGMDEAEVSARRKDLLAVLDFVDEHVIPAAILLDSAFDVREKGDGILQWLGTGVFKVYLDDVVFPDAAFHEMPLEEVEDEIALPASPNPGDDLHEVVVLGIDHALKQQISLDGHGALPACDFMDLSNNPKTWELYHNLSSKASELLEILWISPRNFKLKLALAPCRLRCRAAFRRVAGGVYVEKEAA